MPNLSQKWDNVLVKALFDNWQVSGITLDPERHQAGLLLRLHERSDRRAERHRSDQRRREPARHPLRSQISRGERTFDSSSTRVHRAPVRREPAGERDGDEYQGPGYMNWDFSFFKIVPMGGTRRLQFRDRALQRVQHRPVDRDRHERDVQLRHWCADRRELRQADRRDAECAAASSLARGLPSKPRTTRITQTRGALFGAPFVCTDSRQSGVGSLSRQSQSAVRVGSLTGSGDDAIAIP